MSDTCGPTSSTPFAWYDLESSCWRTSQGTFPWDSGEFSETWPKSGTTVGGRAFELPMSEPAIDASECSSLLLTPSAGDGMGGGRANPPMRGEGTKQGSGGLREQVRMLPTPTTGYSGSTAEDWRARRPAGNGQTREQVGDLRIVVELLLPTPTTQPTTGNGHARNLGAEAKRLLPTPAAWDGERGPDYARANREGSGGDDLLTTIARLGGETMSPPSDATNKQSDDQHPTLWTDEDD